MSQFLKEFFLLPTRWEVPYRRTNGTPAALAAADGRSTIDHVSEERDGRVAVSCCFWSFFFSPQKVGIHQRRKCMNRSAKWILMSVAAAVPWHTALAALIINVNTDGSFTPAQLAVINQARMDWLALLTFNGGDHTIRMNFSTNNTMADLGVTSGWMTDANGRVTSVNVAINTNAHNWTLGAPAPNMDDALDTVRHEMCHALGWTVGLANFNANVLTISGNRFYDLNRDGMFTAADDFDLIDDPAQGTHAPAGSGDLMQPSTPQGTRNAPTMRHAQVLAHAFGFRVVPAPAALGAFCAGLLLLGRRRRAA
jgi:hypothetical protein